MDTGEGPTGPRDRAAHLIGPWALNRAAITCIPGHPHGGDEPAKDNGAEQSGQER